MSSGLVSNPNRDAWKSIRGFVQQAELTVLRWIDLPAGYALALERGEDVDRIATGLAAATDVDRLMEQVKVSETNITLRTKAPVEAMANLADHRANNPGLRLIMRISTTSGRGVENPPILASHRPSASGRRWRHCRPMPSSRPKSRPNYASCVLRSRP